MSTLPKAPAGSDLSRGGRADKRCGWRDGCQGFDGPHRGVHHAALLRHANDTAVSGGLVLPTEVNEVAGCPRRLGVPGCGKQSAAFQADHLSRGSYDGSSPCPTGRSHPVKPSGSRRCSRGQQGRRLR